MKKNKIVNVLDARGSQNISIILSTFQLSLDDALEALRECDEDKLDAEVIQKLKNIKANMVDSLESIKQYTGDCSDLSEIESFVVSLSRIPLYEKRIDSVAFKYNFDIEYTLLSDNVNLLKQAYDAISSNNKFKQIMRIILDVGNFLNYKTPKGNSFGFKLQTLKNMSGFKSK